MHPEIKKFWEKSGKQIFVLDKPNTVKGITNVPFYYFVDDNGMQPVCAPFNGEGMAYYGLDGTWCHEDVMLKMIKMKAFL